MTLIPNIFGLYTPVYKYDDVDIMDNNIYSYD